MILVFVCVCLGYEKTREQHVRFGVISFLLGQLPVGLASNREASASYIAPMSDIEMKEMQS